VATCDTPLPAVPGPQQVPELRAGPPWAMEEMILAEPGLVAPILTSSEALEAAEWIRETDALLVNGGDALYLCHWMRESGLADLLPSLRDSVWVGFSAGSMVLTPRIGEDFVGWRSPSGSDETLGVVDFSIFPHLDHPALPENTMAEAERWASGLTNPAYAIDDDTAIKLVDGTVDVISQGHWKLFAPSPVTSKSG